MHGLWSHSCGGVIGALFGGLLGGLEAVFAVAFRGGFPREE